MSVNKWIGIGNLTQNPEIRSTKDGKEIANFSLATNEKWKSKDGTQQEKVEFHRIVVFSQGLVEVIKTGMKDHWIKKGSKLYLEGSLQTRKWTDKNGIEKYSTEIILQGFNGTLQVLSNNKGNNESIAETAKKELNCRVVEDVDPDIPF